MLGWMIWVAFRLIEHGAKEDPFGAFVSSMAIAVLLFFASSSLTAWAVRVAGRVHRKLLRRIRASTVAEGEGVAQEAVI